MNGQLTDTTQDKLRRLDHQIRKRTALVTIGYSAAILGSIALYVYFPFQMSRVGSVVLVVALAHMIWRVYQAGRDPIALDQHASALHHDLDKVDAQIQLVESLIYNLPFLAGANLFFMGLPGTGSAESKAWLDCYFLFGTTILFAGFYCINQQTVRKELLPLRQELETLIPIRQSR